MTSSLHFDVDVQRLAYVKDAVGSLDIVPETSDYFAHEKLVYPNAIALRHARLQIRKG